MQEARTMRKGPALQEDGNLTSGVSWFPVKTMEKGHENCIE